MYFDDVVSRNPGVKISLKDGSPVYLKNAVPFKFSEELFQEAINYWRGKADLPKMEIDYARTPYQSIFLSFGGTRGYWIIGNDYPEHEIYTLVIFAYDRFSDWYAQRCKNGNIILEDVEYLPGDMAAIEDILKFNLRPRLTTAMLNYGEGNFRVHYLCGQSVDDNTEFDDHLLSSLWIFHIVLRVLTLLNCRNIKTIKHPAPGQKLQRKRQRRGKLPIASYYTMEIDLQKNNAHGSGLKTGT
ncbi:MAG: hypothetical protein ACE5GM_11305, partial [bacterium]